jgi:nucleotide-binding universal stress UspA family protein
MHKLLIAFDGSESSKRALQYALRLARENGPVELVLVHAHEPPLVYGEVSLYMTEDKARELLQERSQEVLRPALDLAAQAGVGPISEVLSGSIPQSIVDCAVRHGCDGIVMGTRGLSAIGNLVMGSVATKVVHLAKVPVTLVK